jgi:hypothetical protein
VGAEVERAAVDDDAADRRAVTAEELRRAVHDDVGAVLDRAQRYGVGTVLSTTSGTPTSWATSAMPRMSSTLLRGLPSVSAKNSRVRSLAAARQASRSSGSSTNVTSMPSFGKV